MTGGTAGDTSRREGSQIARDRRLDAARGYLALDMPEHALRELAAIRDPHRCRFALSRLRGDALRAVGRFEEASSAYGRALVERPDSLPVLMGAATCHRQLGRLDRAVAALEEANRSHPNEPAVVFALARLYVLSGETQRSLGWLGRAIRLCPDVAAFAERDADFAPLQNSPHFRLLVEAGLARDRA